MPGHGFGYGYGAVGHARRAPLMAGGGTPTPTPAPDPTLPALDAIVAHYDSAAIVPQADNTALAAWDDISGSGAHAAQADGAKQPRYRTGGAGGRPYVAFDGTDDHLLIAAPGALRTAMDSQSYTVLAVIEGAAGGDHSCIFGVGDGGSNPWLWAGATNIGWSAVNTNARVAGAGAGFQTLGLVSEKGELLPGFNPDFKRHVYRGTLYACSTLAAGATGGGTLRIGAGLNGTAFPFKGRIYRILVWNRRLSPAELMAAEAYFCQFYSQSHPAVEHGRFLHLDGDSRTAGIGASGDAAAGYLPYKIASGLDFPLGTYSVHAIGGIRIDQLIAKGGEIDAAAQALAGMDPAIAHRLIYEEYFNSRALAVGDTATAGTLAYQTAEYLAARRAGMPGGLRIMGQSPCDHAGTSLPQPTAWAAYMQANRAALGLDGLADVWASAIGGEAACPDSPPYAPYWADGIHLTAAGQDVQAGVVISACNALAGW